MNESYSDPTRNQFEAFKNLDRDKPIEMLNLVRFRDKALYADDHELAGQDLTGAQAYANYGAATGPLLKGVGGQILWRGHFETTLIGPEDEAWDAVFIGRYPTAHAFLEMITSDAYQIAVKHRHAAVLTSRLVRCGEASEGNTFG